MSRERHPIEQRLLDEGLAALDDADVARAVAADPRLAALVSALREVDDRLAALPAVGVPKGLVERTLARVRAETTASHSQSTTPSAVAAAPSAEPAPLPWVTHVRPAAPSSPPKARPPRSELAPRGLSDWLGVLVIGAFELVVHVLEWLVRRPVLALVSLVFGFLPVLSLGLLLTVRGGQHDQAPAQAPYDASESASAIITADGDYGRPLGGNGAFAGGSAGPVATALSASPQRVPAGSLRPSSGQDEDGRYDAVEEEREELRSSNRPSLQGQAGGRDRGERQQTGQDRTGGEVRREAPRDGRGSRTGDQLDQGVTDRPAELELSAEDLFDMNREQPREVTAREPRGPTPSPAPQPAPEPEPLGDDEPVELRVTDALSRNTRTEDERQERRARDQGDAAVAEPFNRIREVANGEEARPVHANEAPPATLPPERPDSSASPGGGGGLNLEDRDGFLAADATVELFAIEGAYSVELAPSQDGFYQTLDPGDLDNLTVARYAGLARGWLDERELTGALTFVEAAGYWANTYVPGDPLLRSLRAQLRQRDETSRRAASGFALARSANPVDQPFDVPNDAALAVYLQADRRQVDGEARVLLQVGLQATERRSGRRPAMNVVVVLDRHQPLSPTQAGSVRALLESLSEARDVGDRFSLIAAEQPPRMLIEPGDFRYGSVQVAARELLDSGVSGVSQVEAIVPALDLAFETLGAQDDPTAPLGSSLILLVTPGGFGATAATVSAYAHAAAIDGVPLSVVGVGPNVEVAELDSIVLAGQGNRRLLVEPGAARDLVDQELAAAGRAVARAVRLRIRLARGVRLVDVLGSVRLDEQQAERVREVERAVDIQVSRALGIQADRGEDEDGIQIVIPAFYAGDSHVILLDLVVPGAGPVADVTARYKDLVFLRNAVAADNLTLQRGAGERGPLERNVLANLLAFELSTVLAEAGELARVGYADDAISVLSEFAGLLQGLQTELPGFATSPALQGDLELLSGYLLALERGDMGVGELGESLLYASFLKRVRPPAEVE